MLDEQTADMFGTLPRWRQIELSILKEIDGGAFGIGEQLPGENTLALQFGVTRMTVRRALSELRHKGVVRIEKGRGAFIERRLRYAVGPYSSFKANLASASLVPSSRILRKFAVKAPSEIASKLSIEPGETVFVFETLGRGSDVTLSFTRHHLPVWAFPDALSRVTSFACITEVYQAFGFRKTRRKTCEIAARLPTPDEARHLDQSNGEPILEVRSVKVAGKKPIDFTVARFASSRVSVVVDN